MKHLLVELKGTDQHDKKGFLCKVINDSSGEPQVLSDSDASYWMNRMEALGLESFSWETESLQQEATIKDEDN